MSWRKFPKWLMLTLLVAACESSSAAVLDRQQNQPVAKPKVETPARRPQPAAPQAQTLTGSYVGEFVPDIHDAYQQSMRMAKINLSIETVAGNKITGHSAVGGAIHAFSGSIVESAPGKFTVKAEQPGDKASAGSFSFTLTPPRINGRWVPQSKQDATPAELKKLEKKTFKYDPKQTLKASLVAYYAPTARIRGSYNQRTNKWEVITADAAKLNASVKLLTSEDVENMYRRDLEVMRNAILARHGYVFTDPEMRFFFDRVDWYMPVTTDVTAHLTEVEQKNIALIQRYEQYATTYYRHFGR